MTLVHEGTCDRCGARTEHREGRRQPHHDGPCLPLPPPATEHRVGHRVGGCRTKDCRYCALSRTHRRKAIEKERS